MATRAGSASLKISLSCVVLVMAPTMAFQLREGASSEGAASEDIVAADAAATFLEVADDDEDDAEAGGWGM